MYRGHRRFWLARAIVARRPLMAHIAKHRLLEQAFGLTWRTAEASQRLSALPERSLGRIKRVALPSARLVFRPLLIRQANSEDGNSPGQDEPVEVPGQQVANAQSGNQDLEVGGQVPLPTAEQLPEQPGTESTGSRASESGSEIPIEQKGADAQTQTKEIAKAKLSRGRIVEQPPEVGDVLASPAAPSTSLTRRDARGEKALEKSDVNVAVPGSEVSESDELFAPRNTDRSPQAWLTRLMEAARSAALADSDPSRIRPSSAPLSQRTRRFLQPLVGVDPASVRVHRDEIAERLTNVYQADAITVGDEVEVAAGYPDDTPETLGLLAHELTHVAREREPRFIPPIARSMRPSLSRASQSSLADEETLALQVESQVKRVAQKQVEQIATVPLSKAANDAWGGLPAPWEPLPDWLLSLPGTAGGSAQVPVVLSQPPPVPHGTNMIHGGGDIGAGDTGVQRAGTERSVDMEEGQAATSTANATKAPEPNLDELARQVYSLLKRRLGVEYRREN